MYAGMMLFDKYGLRPIGLRGPNMNPTLEGKYELYLVDLFTTRVIRRARKG